MPDIVYFAGSGIDCVVPNTGVSEAGNFAQSGFTPGSILVTTGATDYFDCPLIDASGVATTVTEFWTHFGRGCQDRANNVTNMEWRKSDGTPVLRIQSITSPGNWNNKVEFWNGSAWVLVGSPVYEGFSQYHVWDIYCKIDASVGTVVVLLDGSALFTYTGNTSGMSSVASLRCYGQGTGNSYYQQMMVANFNTVGHTIRMRRPTGNGANTAWAGDWTSVDEFPYSDADYCTSAIAAQKETFTAAALSATPVGQVIKAVSLGLRCRRDITGPQNIKAMLRISSTDYVSSYNQLGVGLGFSGGITVWTTNPNTSAPWASVSEANCEFGMQSVT